MEFQVLDEYWLYLGEPQTRREHARASSTQDSSASGAKDERAPTGGPPGVAPRRGATVPGGGRYSFIQRSSQPITVSCQRMLLRGLSTQWFSSGK